MTVLEAHIAFKIEADKNAVNIGISGVHLSYLRKLIIGYTQRI